jgi:hypothetical protein
MFIKNHNNIITLTLDLNEQSPPKLGNPKLKSGASVHSTFDKKSLNQQDIKEGSEENSRRFSNCSVDGVNGVNEEESLNKKIEDSVYSDQHKIYSDVEREIKPIPNAEFVQFQAPGRSNTGKEQNTSNIPSPQQPPQAYELESQTQSLNKLNKHPNMHINPNTSLPLSNPANKEQNNQDTPQIQNQNKQHQLHKLQEKQNKLRIKHHHQNNQNNSKSPHKIKSKKSNKSINHPQHPSSPLNQNIHIHNQEHHALVISPLHLVQQASGSAKQKQSQPVFGKSKNSNAPTMPGSKNLSPQNFELALKCDQEVSKINQNVQVHHTFQNNIMRNRKPIHPHNDASGKNLTTISRMEEEVREMNAIPSKMNQSAENNQITHKISELSIAKEISNSQNNLPHFVPDTKLHKKMLVTDECEINEVSYEYQESQIKEDFKASFSDLKRTFTPIINKHTEEGTHKKPNKSSLLQ